MSSSDGYPLFRYNPLPGWLADYLRRNGSVEGGQREHYTEFGIKRILGHG
ncbi:MAG: hypothetical protein KJ638_12395 [Chloroflexi bacterium]|nr:hypothetical protein [Chloroflexota bacterium]